MRWRGAIIGLVGFALAVLLAGCGAEPFEPNGPEATAAREQARTEAERMLGDVHAGSEPIASGRFDGCREGQNNWKIQDQYEHECFVVASALVPAAGSDDEVSGALQELSGRLEELGCATTGRTLAQLDQDYWQTQRRQPEYSPGSLPETRYECTNLRVVVQPSDPSTIEDDLPPGPVVFLDELLSEEPYPDDVADRVEASGASMLWVLTAEAFYYANEF